MLNIRNFYNKGIFNTESLKEDLKKDLRFFNKKSNSFTKSGEEKMNFIKEISDAQNKGFKYSFSDNHIKIRDNNNNLLSDDQLINIHKDGGKILKSQFGKSLPSFSTSYKNSDGLSVRDELDLEESYRFKPDSKFENNDEDIIVPPIYGPEDNINKFIFKASKPVVLGSTDELKSPPLESRKNIIRNLSNKTIDLASLVPTAIKWKIARDAIKKPVANVKAPQDIFRPGHVRTVRNIEGLDSTSLRSAKNKILNQKSEYKGSDPVLDTIFKQTSSRNKSESLVDLDLKNAEAVRQSAELQRQELNEHKQGLNANLQGETSLRNLNNRLQADADLKNAEALVKRRSDRAAIDISAVEEAAAILANKRVTDQQFKSGLAAEKIKSDRESLKLDASNKYNTYDQNLYKFNQGIISQKQLDDSKKEYERSLDNYKVYNSEEQIIKQKTLADREGGFIDYISSIFKK